VRTFALGFILLFVLIPSALSASAGERALVWAESQRDAALGAVMVARHRLEIAESDLSVSRNVERDISSSKDKAALSIAHEAVSVSEQGVIEAQSLLKRAATFLSRQEKTIAEVKKFITENNDNKALVIPVEGTFRIAQPGRSPFENKEIIGSLRKGDRIEVGSNSSAHVFVSGGNDEIALSQNTSLTLSRNQADDSFEGLLNEGFIQVKAAIQGKYAHKFEVRTPTVVVAVRGTAFSVQVSPAKTRVEVFESTVYLSSIQGGAGVEVHAGEGCDVLKEGSIQPVTALDGPPRSSPWSDHAKPN
jgi:hypothetical protein